MITIKILSIESIDEIIAFDKLCFPVDNWREEAWKDLLKDERSVYYALIDQNNIVGDVFIYNWKGEKDYIKIMNLAIHPDYRKQGLAHKLLNYVTDEMKKLDMKRYCGETRASNKKMQKVFEDCGYTLSKIEEHYYTIGDESAYKYVLQLLK